MKSIDPASTHANPTFLHADLAISSKDLAASHVHCCSEETEKGRRERRGRADGLAPPSSLLAGLPAGNSGDSGEGRVRRGRLSEAGAGNREPPVVQQDDVGAKTNRILLARSNLFTSYR